MSDEQKGPKWRQQWLGTNHPRYKKKHLISSVSVACSIPREDAKEIVEIILNRLRHHLEKNKIVVVRRFGKFMKQIVKSGKDGRKAHIRFRFKASRSLRRILHGGIDPLNKKHRLKNPD